MSLWWHWGTWICLHLGGHLVLAGNVCICRVENVLTYIITTDSETSPFDISVCVAAYLRSWLCWCQAIPM